MRRDDTSDGAGSDAGDLPEITVPVHGTTRYLRTRLGVEDGILRWEVPRAILGIIPAGVRHVEVPLAQVRSVDLRTVVHPLRLVIALALVVVPLLLGFWWLAIPMGFAAVWIVLVSFGPHLEVVTRAGKKYRAGICIGHQFDAELYAEAVSDLATQACAAASSDAAD